MKIGKIARHYRGASTPVIELGGLLYSNTTPVAIVTPAATLMSVTIPKEFLASAGDSIELDALFSANTITNDLEVKFDGVLQSVVSSGVGTRIISYKALFVRNANILCTGMATQYAGFSEPFVWTYVWGGSDLVVSFVGSNTTQTLLRVKAFPAA